MTESVPGIGRAESKRYIRDVRVAVNVSFDMRCGSTIPMFSGDDIRAFDIGPRCVLIARHARHRPSVFVRVPGDDPAVCARWMRNVRGGLSGEWDPRTPISIGCGTKTCGDRRCETPVRIHFVVSIPFCRTGNGQVAVERALDLVPVTLPTLDEMLVKAAAAMNAPVCLAQRPTPDEWAGRARPIEESCVRLD